MKSVASVSYTHLKRITGADSYEDILNAMASDPTSVAEFVSSPVKLQTVPVLSLIHIYSLYQTDRHSQSGIGSTSDIVTAHLIQQPLSLIHISFSVAEGCGLCAEQALPADT